MFSLLKITRSDGDEDDCAFKDKRYPLASVRVILWNAMEQN
ncbi:hypothetical protein [uncultured Flavobacterium sp.]